MKLLVKECLKWTPAYRTARRLYYVYLLKLAGAWVRGVRRFGFGYRCTIGFTPDRIDDYSLMTRIMLLNRYRSCPSSGTAPDIAIYWAYGAGNVEPDPNWRLSINERCRDISKSYVDRWHHEIFGYGLSVDPLTFRGSAFVKSDENGLHDGRIEELPVSATTPGVVYQRLVANEMLDGTRQDIRVPVVGNSIPFVFLVYRRLEATISGRVMGSTKLCETTDILSKTEIEDVLRLCAALGLDFGELDAARDRNDGRLYVVDVNRAVGKGVRPRELATEAEYWQQLVVLADLFDSTFVTPVLGRRRCC